MLMSSDPDTFGDDGDTAFGDGEASGIIGFRVNTDLGTVGDHDILVQDRAMDDCVTPDDGMGQDHRMVHLGVLVHVDVGREHRTLDGTTRHDATRADDGVPRRLSW